jgi:hypothetical protein
LRRDRPAGSCGIVVRAEGKAMTISAARSLVLLGFLAGCGSSAPSGPGPGSGGPIGTGGTPSGTGGAQATGGAPSSTGGAPPSTGGAPPSTGGGEADAGSGPADSGQAPDRPARGDVGVGILPPGDKHVVVLHGTNTAGDPLRGSLMGVLAAMRDSHGVIYEEMIDKQIKAPMLMDKALVIVAGNSDFCESEQDPAFGDLPVPIIVSKDCDRTTMIFKLGTMHNTPNDQTKIHISNPLHPLAAGLMGDVAVFPSNSRIVNASDLGPEAVVVATAISGGNPCIFYYDKGAAMLNGFPAPGKRMGFFWHRPTVGTDGAKKLLTAAVDWMLRERN